MFKIYPNILKATDQSLEKFEEWVDEIKENITDDIKTHINMIAIVEDFIKMDKLMLQYDRDGFTVGWLFKRKNNIGYIGEITVYELKNEDM